MADPNDYRVFHEGKKDSIWMVILNGGRGIPTFLSDEAGYCLLFDDSGDAMEAGLANGLGFRRGFIIVPWEYKE
jgi:hypothetical protein